MSWTSPDRSTGQGIAGAIARLIREGYNDITQALSEVIDDPTHEVGARLRTALDGTTKSDLRSFVFYGDSITQGNQDGTGITFPGLLATALGITSTNRGVSGWTSTEVAVRVGMPVTLGAFTIPADASQVGVTVTDPIKAFRPEGTTVTVNWMGTVAGIAGVLRHHVHPTDNAPDEWTFERLTAGSGTVAVPAGSTFTSTEEAANRGLTAVISVGRNNTSDPAVVVRDAKDMIARLTPDVKRYVVLAVIATTGETSGTGGFNQVKAINDALRTEFGNRFCDVNNFLVTRGLAYNSIAPTAADTTAIAGGTCPPSLKVVDGVHPNQYGYRAMARAIYEALVSLDWVKDKPNPALLAPAAPPASYVWKASDLALADGAAVTSWPSTGTASSASIAQGTAAKQPTMATVGGKKYVSFDGVDDQLGHTTLTVAQPCTVVARTRFRDVAGKTAGQAVLWPNSSGANMRINAVGTASVAGSAQAVTSASGTVVANTDVVLAGVFDATNSRISINGTAGTVGNIQASDGVKGVIVGYGFLGGGNQWSGMDLAELRIYGVALSADQIANVYTEMMA